MLPSVRERSVTALTFPHESIASWRVRTEFRLFSFEVHEGENRNSLPGCFRLGWLRGPNRGEEEGGAKEKATFCECDGLLTFQPGMHQNENAIVFF